MVAKFGAPSLIAAGLLIVSWFFLTTASIKSPLGSIEFTFWQVLGYLNAKNIFEVMMSGGRGGPSAGIYGFFAIAALAGHSSITSGRTVAPSSADYCRCSS